MDTDGEGGVCPVCSGGDKYSGPAAAAAAAATPPPLPSPPPSPSAAGRYNAAAAAAQQHHHHHKHHKQQQHHHHHQQQQRDRERQRQRGATPLLYVILYASVACKFPVGFQSSLSRNWLLALPGVAESLSGVRCDYHLCPLPDPPRGLRAAFVLAPELSRLAGSAAGAWLLRARGRRAALLAANVLSAIGFAVAAAAMSYAQLLAGVLMSDFSAGLVFVAIVVVDAEIAPARRRLAFIYATANVAIGVGWSSASSLALAQAAVAESNRVWFWRAIVAFGAWPCMLLLVIVPFVPESPLLLVQRGRTAEALQTLKDLRGPFADTSAEFSGIIHACAEAEAEDARLRRRHSGWLSLVPLQARLLLSPKHRPCLAVTLLVAAICGVDLAATSVGRGMEAAMQRSFERYSSWMIARFLSPLACPFGGLLMIALDVDRFSRRKLLVVGTGVITASLAGLAIVGGAPFGGPDQPPHPRPLAVATFALSAALLLAFEICIKPSGYLLPAELSATGVRGAAVAAFFVGYHTARFLWGLAATLPSGVLSGGLYVGPLATALVAAPLAVLVWLFVPEGTQRAPLEECRHAWQKHWFWGRRKGLWAINLRATSGAPAAAGAAAT